MIITYLNQLFLIKVVNAANITSLPDPLNNQTIGQILNNALNWLIAFAGPICVLMIIVGAFQILTAGGNTEKVITGRRTITYTSIGFGIVLISKGLIYVISDILGVPAPNGVNAGNVNSASSVLGIFVSAAKWARAVFFVTAAFMFIMAAFYYLTAAGNEEKIKKAKSMLVYGAVAVIITLLSYAAVYIIGNFVGESI